MDVQLTACRHHPSTQADQLRKTHAFIEGKERLTMHIIFLSSLRAHAPG
ncbi:hypothetical protein ALP28_02213 [Pseudomonas savastanoi pv. nerii]|nr:hypothetical protein ALP28_02213 [Pseudomonas savastanoi pv. nerii]